MRIDGDFSELLMLSASDIKEMIGNKTIRAVINKLDDVANKRIGRLVKKGIEDFSPMIRTMKKEERERLGLKSSDDVDVPRFSLPKGNLSEGELLAKYLDVRNFLNAKTSSIKGTKEYNADFEEIYQNVTRDKRYKNKFVQRKNAKKLLSKFWRKYDEWKEIEAKKSGKDRGDTNVQDVSYFEQEIWEKGNTRIDQLQEKATQKYIEEQQKMGNGGMINEDIGIRFESAKRGRKGTPQRTKQPQRRNTRPIKQGSVRVSFEQVNIFADIDDDEE